MKYANYRGGAKKEIKGEELLQGNYDRAELLACRGRLLRATTPIARRATGGEYCRVVRGILDDFDAKGKLKMLTESIEDVAFKSYLSQIEGAIERLLTEAELLIGETEMTVAEFEAVLSDGLDAAEISLIPMKADAVI